MNWKKMDEREISYGIKRYSLKGKSIQETKSRLNKYCGVSALLTRTVYKWYGYFRSSRTRTNDAEHSRWPVEVTGKYQLAIDKISEKSINKILFRNILFHVIVVIVFKQKL